jgi:glycosyltransferase involved in cell wall biosynthesis
MFDVVPRSEENRTHLAARSGRHDGRSGGELRVLFVNQDVIGNTVLGHRQTELMLRRSVEHTDVVARFDNLPPRRLYERVIGARVPGLWARDLDFHAARWHVAEGLRARRALRAHVDDFAPDVIHLHSHALGFAARRYMRSTPTILSVDAPVRAWQTMAIWHPLRPHTELFVAPAIWQERSAVRSAALVLAWSNWAATELRKDVPMGNIVLHHPGIDTTIYRPAVREPRARPRVLFVGSRFQQKGGFDLLESLAPHLGRELELDLVTPFEIRPRDGVRVHRLDVGSEPLIRLFQQADVFYLPTHGDASPWAILEALSCGTPVVATAVGGIPDLVQHRQTGYLVPPYDHRGLHDSLLNLALDPALRRAFGSHARADVETRFDVRRQGAIMVDYMRNVALSPQCPRGAPAHPASST